MGDIEVPPPEKLHAVLRKIYEGSDPDQLTMRQLRRKLEKELGYPELSLDTTAFKQKISDEFEKVLGEPKQVRKQETKAYVEKTKEIHKKKPRSSSLSSDAERSDKGTVGRSGSDTNNSSEESDIEPTKRTPKKVRTRAVKKSKGEDHLTSSEKKIAKLEATIKGCGLRVPRQAMSKLGDRDKIKALMAVLDKEGIPATGLSKERMEQIKEQRQLAKEMEAIDPGQIVQGSRRRPAPVHRFAPPPKSKAAAKRKSESGDDSSCAETAEAEAGGESAPTAAGDKVAKRVRRQAKADQESSSDRPAENESSEATEDDDKDEEEEEEDDEEDEYEPDEDEDD